MNRTVRRSLQSVSIGPYKYTDGTTPSITTEDETGQKGGLFDPRMGLMAGIDGDRASSFGIMGSIPIGQYIINPVFEDVLVEYLNMFDLIHGRLRFKSTIRRAIEDSSSLLGYRKMKEISSLIGKKGTRWKINVVTANIAASSKQSSATLAPSELRDILIDATDRYTSGRENVLLSEVGINTEVSKPEDFVISDIPVLPVTMRRPYITGKSHPLTDIYKSIISAIRSRNLGNIRSSYFKLVKSGEEANLREDVFSSSKNGFIRGSVLSKTGGQIARSVAGANIHLKPYEIGVPRRFSLDLSQRVEVTEDNIPDIQSLIAEGHITHILDRRTGQYIPIRDATSVLLIPNKMLVLRQLEDGDAVIANRQPTLHRNGMLAFKVVLHDDDVIYTHPSVSTGFGLDYDGDELNIIVPYSELGKREANELMFSTYHMASMASSSLIIGYHQDVNLGAHMLTLAGTMIRDQLWRSVSTIVYNTLWSDRYATYDAWYDSFKKRCSDIGVDMYHGRSLYSTLLPEDMNWSSDSAKIEKGILISGTIDKSNASGSPSSIGMNLYRVYGSDVCVNWLNASYIAMNEYLVKSGITLGIDEIQLPQELQERVNTSISTYLDIHEELFPNKDEYMRPEARARYDASVLQDLNNIRERVAKMIIDYLSDRHKLRVSNIDLHLGDIDMTLDHKVEGSILKLEDGKPVYSLVYDSPVEVDINMYDGYIRIGSMELSMGVFPTIVLDGETYTRDMPSPLLLMTKSGARGNETNIIQISGIIGQQSFANGRIPMMMSGGTRTMPCFDFNENTPESRGHIASSYRMGMSPSAYMAAHVASRENLTSNTDLTPKTGYFARRLRVFMENLSINRKNGRQLVSNERGAVIMWDFMMDPSKMFSINKRRTFIDIDHELQSLRSARSRDAIVITVPYRRNLSSYISISKNIEAVRALYPTMDIILSMNHAIESRHPDFYEHMRERYTTVTDGGYWYLEHRDYDRIMVIPANIRPNVAIDMSKLNDGHHINISQASITGISYPSRQGEIIGARTLYDMLTLGTSFTDYPMIVKTGIEGESLLTSLIDSGNIYAL